jgi:predicted nucleotidyltransferase
MTYWTGWAGYARTMLASVSSELSMYESQLGVFRSKEMLRIEGQFKTVTAAKAAVEELSEVQERVRENQPLKAKKALLQAVLTTYEERSAVISREISRRGMDFSEASRKRG